MNLMSLGIALILLAAPLQVGCSDSDSEVSAPHAPRLTAGPDGPTGEVTTRPIREDEQIETASSGDREVIGSVGPVSFGEPGEAEAGVPPNLDLPEIDADRQSRRGGSPRGQEEVNNINADEKRPGLAVVPFKVNVRTPSQSITASDGETFSNFVLGHIKSKRYRLFERQQLDAILREKDFAGSSGIASDNEAIRAGKLTGIRYLVVGEITSLGGEFYLQARVVDCLTGEIGDRSTVRFRGVADAFEATERLVSELALDGDPEPDPSRPSSGTRAPPIPADIFDAQNPGSTMRVEVSTVDGKDGFIPGERIEFMIRANTSCYVTILSRNSAGQVVRLLPNEFSSSSFLPNGSTMVVPPTSVGAGEQRYRFTAAPPFGRTEVKVIATKKPLKLPSLDGAVGAGGFKDLGSAGGDTMRRVNTEWGRATRDKSIHVVADDPDPAQRGDSDVQTEITPESWAESDLVLYTASNAEELDRMRGRWSPGSDPPSDPDPRRDPEQEYDGDANDAVLDEWTRAVGGSFGQLSASSKSASGGGNAPLAAPNRILVIYKPGRAPADKDLGSDSVALARVNPNLRSIAVPAVPGSKSVAPGDLATRLRELRENPDVLVAVPNYPVKAMSAPVDLDSLQWGKSNRFRPGVDVGWSRQAISGSSPVLVGVIDQGLDVSDPRLRAFAWTNPGEVPGDGIDNDRNSVVDDVHGFNPWSWSGDVEWRAQGGTSRGFNHGSFCASIVAARHVGHAKDLEGMAPGSRVISAVALDVNGAGNMQAFVLAVNYAVIYGARVLNVSLGGLFDGQDGRPGPEEFAQVQALFAQVWPAWSGVLFVCAAGNDRNDNDRYPVWPASLGFSNIISVAAIDPEGLLARAPSSDDPGDRRWRQFSNFGANSVHAAAPGSLVIGIPGPQAADINYGTSFAAPIVTAAAALAWGQNPSMTPEQVKQRIIEATTPLEALEGKVVSGGIINFRKLLGRE